MSDHEQDTEKQEPDDQRADDDLLERQERKGYGEDEGERDESLEG